MCESQTCLLRKVCIIILVYTFLKFLLFLSIYVWFYLFSFGSYHGRDLNSKKGARLQVETYNPLVEGMGRNKSLERLMNYALNSTELKIH